jgi:hypothetical protein
MKALWKSMIQRCHNPNNPSYPNYGGRGVKVCARWRRSYAAFEADVGPRPVGSTLDRIDGTKGYKQDNVRWASKREQAINRSTTRIITWRGRSMSILDWARETGINDATIGRRLNRGWLLERALTAPPDTRFGRSTRPENVRNAYTELKTAHSLCTPSNLTLR